MVEIFSDLIKELLEKLNFSNQAVKSINLVILLGSAFIISYLLFILSRYIVSRYVKKIVSKTSANWDDIMFKHKVFTKGVLIIPAFFLYFIDHSLFDDFPKYIEMFERGLGVYSSLVFMLIINALLKSMNDIYMSLPGATNRPIKGYVQTLQIIVTIIVLIFILSILLSKSPMVIIGGAGAFAAVLMLIFKDAILGFVAGIQLSFNDMVRLGDWITMPKYNADGTVIDIALTTVKIQNGDKTISNIPSYALIADSFQNWRGMEESEGRRIKRSFFVDMNSIKFLDEELKMRLMKVQVLREYFQLKETEIEVYNAENEIDTSFPVNGRKQTNIGVFRAYLKEYLRTKQEINDGMTFTVRQLQPLETGLPIEVYVFSKIKNWADYEDLQSDIFDHIFAVIEYFDLRVFQNPSGSDFIKIVKSNM